MHATVPGMFQRLVVVMTLVACGSSPPPPSQPAGRPVSGRDELPPALAAIVPKHGVVIAGGGTKSSVFRVIVDTDGKTIYTGSAPAGTPVLGKLAEERTRELTPRNEQHLMQLSADAWSERPPAGTYDPVEGYEEWFVVADGEELFILFEPGPIKRPKAVTAMEALRAAAAL
jgi:hypothetical protein